MRTSLGWVLLLAAVVGQGGCGEAKCTIDDEECILSHIEFYESAHTSVDGGVVVTGEKLKLTLVPEWVFQEFFGNQGAHADGGSAHVDAGDPSGYIGCFVDESSHDLTGAFLESDQMTIEYCASTCREGGFAYFALEGATQCYCGQSYGRYGAAPAVDCYMKCSGNSEEICGGYLRESVYRVIQPNPATGTAATGVVCPPGFPHLCPGNYCCPNDRQVCCPGHTCGQSTCSGSTTNGQPTTCPPAAPISCNNGYCCDQGHTSCCPAAICSDNPSCDQQSGANLAPAILSAPSNLAFSPKKQTQYVPVGWTDPTGCQPAFCMSFKTKQRTFSKRVCTPQIRDGLTNGVWRTAMKVTYEPAETQTTTMEIFPITFCQGDPLKIMNDYAVKHNSGYPIPAGEGIPLGGAGIMVEVEVAPPPPFTWGSSACSGYYGGGSMACKVCSIQACVSASGSSSGLGSCAAGYLTSTGQYFPCNSCSNCTGAAQSVTAYCCPPEND